MCPCKSRARTALLGGFTHTHTHRFSTRVTWLCGFLSHVDPRARIAAAKLVGVAAAALQPQGASLLCVRSLDVRVPSKHLHTQAVHTPVSRASTANV